jgi:hypothetical protein
VSLCLGESPLVGGNVRIGEFKLNGIPAANRGKPQIVIEFAVDPTCAVTARATLQDSQVSAEERFELPVGLSDEFIARVLENAESSRQADETKLLQIEATNRAKMLIEQAERRLEQSPNEKLSEAVAAVGLALASKDSAKIREEGDGLERLLNPPGAAPFSDIFADFFQAKPLSRAPKKSRVVKRTGPPEQELASSPPPPSLGRIFGGGNFTLDPQLCFVLMPFDAALQPLYDDHIRGIVEGAGLRCERADEIRGTTLITWDIWERINRARFLVAELTHQNANVFYELGLAHALSKEVILLTQSMEYVPFDLRTIRCLCYEFTPRGTKKLEKDLAATIEALMKSS